MRIDLHAHSTASDGTVSPGGVMAAAAAAGLDVVALSDHDTTAGWHAAAAALPPGLTLVPAAELSCRWYTATPPVGLHLLAYLFDPDHPPLVAELARMRRSRLRRAERMVELLRAGGFRDVTWEQVREIAGGDTVGRPHVAEALRRGGHIGSIGEAFVPQWLGERFYLPNQDMDVFTALRLVRAAGGVAVVAHPGRPGRCVPDELLVRLARDGLFGLEADHHQHAPAERERMRALAADLGLVTTGSSDFHGTAKPVRIGADTTDPAVYQRIVAAATGSRPITAVAR